MSMSVSEAREAVDLWTIILRTDLESDFDKETIAMDKKRLHQAKLDLRAAKAGEERRKSDKEVWENDFYNALLAF